MSQTRRRTDDQEDRRPSIIAVTIDSHFSPERKCGFRITDEHLEISIKTVKSESEIQRSLEISDCGTLNNARGTPGYGSCRSGSRKAYLHSSSFPRFLSLPFVIIGAASRFLAETVLDSDVGMWAGPSTGKGRRSYRRRALFNNGLVGGEQATRRVYSAMQMRTMRYSSTKSVGRRD